MVLLILVCYKKTYGTKGKNRSAPIQTQKRGKPNQAELIVGELIVVTWVCSLISLFPFQFHVSNTGSISMGAAYRPAPAGLPAAVVVQGAVLSESKLPCMCCIVT
jgi:hypothetical protein